MTEQEQLSAVVAATVTEVVRQQNGNDTPKTWMEFAWKGSKTFGVPVVALGVFLLIAYKTVPDWVKSNIATQQSLMKNLDRQTEIFEKQIQTQEQIADSVEQIDESTASIMAIEEESQAFMAVVVEEHTQNQEEHQTIMADHKIQMEKLTTIETAVAN